MNQFQVIRRAALFSAISALIVISFQNCSPAGVTFGEGSLLTSKGNGDIYGGKNYVITLDDGECADGSKLDSVISQETDKFSLIRENCQRLNPAVELRRDEIDLVEGGLIYDDRLYVEERVEEEQTTPPPYTEDGRLEGKALCSGTDSSGTYNLILGTKVTQGLETYSEELGPIKAVAEIRITDRAGTWGDNVYLNYEELIQQSGHSKFVVFQSKGYSSQKRGSFYLGFSGESGGLKARISLVWNVGTDPLEFQAICQLEGSYFESMINRTEPLPPMKRETSE